MFCLRCGAEAGDNDFFCHHCGLTFDPRPLKPEEQKLHRVCKGCELRRSIRTVIASLDGDSGEGWYQIIAIDESCEECSRLQNFRLSKEDLILVIPPEDDACLSECICGIIYCHSSQEVEIPKRKLLKLNEVPKNPDGSYNISGLSSDNLADLIWEEDAIQDKSE